MKRERKKGNKKQIAFKYAYFIKNGSIHMAKNEEEITGEPLNKEYSEIYFFLTSRKEYLMQQPEKNEKALKELNIYFNHLHNLIFANYGKY